MKANEVMRILRISRPTLHEYIKSGKIRGTKLHNGQYDYDDASIYELLNKGTPRKTYIYGRVSTSSQKRDLANQMDMLKQFCFANGYVISGCFQDIASGISFKDRNDLFRMLDDIVAGQVERVVITYKDRLSRVGFELFYYLFQKYNCEIVVMSEVGSVKMDSEEIFEEIVSLLHCYSMKMYSKQRVQRIKEALDDSTES